MVMVLTTNIIRPTGTITAKIRRPPKIYCLPPNNRVMSKSAPSDLERSDFLFGYRTKIPTPNAQIPAYTQIRKANC